MVTERIEKHHMFFKNTIDKKNNKGFTPGLRFWYNEKDGLYERAKVMEVVTG